MTPNFALTLSFEGIRLLHRSPPGSPLGWTVVGEVPLDERDLAGGLAAMRATAAALEPGGIRTKVMLPPEQVRLLEAAVPGGEAAREALGEAAGDVAIDHAVAGGRNLVAAVAREVLDEAESFVAAHRFNPVCFAAVLPDGAFPGEAFFGETRLARGGPERVERDAEPTVPQERRAVAADGGLADTKGKATWEASPARAGTDGAAAQAESAQAADPPPAGQDLIAAPGSRGQEREGPTSQAEPPRTGPAVEAAIVAAPLATEAPLSATGIPEPVFASRAHATSEPRDATGGPLRAPARPTALRSAAPTRGPVRDSPAGARSNPPVSRLAAAPEADPVLVATAAPMASAGVAGPPHAEPALRPAPRPAPRPASRAAENAQREAVESLRVRGKPRFLGLMLTAVLVLAMLAVGVWASSTGRGIAGFLGFRDAPEVAAAPDPSPEPPPAAAAATIVAAPAAPDPVQVAGAAAAVAAAMEALPAPEPAVASGTSVSPAEAERVYAATGVWLRAPSLADLPDGEAGAPEVAATPEAAPPRPVLPEAPVAATADAGFAAPPAPPVPGAASPAALASAEPPARPDAAADSPAFVNAMAVAPALRPAPRPAESTLPASMLAAASPAPVAPPATGAPLGQPGVVPGGIAAAALGQAEGQLAPPPRALAFTEAEGEVAGAAGAVGLAAFDGSRPPARPEDLAPDAAVAVLASFDGPRPGPRPVGLAPDEPTGDAVAEAGHATDPASIEAAVAAAQAAGIAPPGAPTELTPDAEAPVAPAPDVQSTLASIVAGAPDPLAGATRQAVAVARVPDARPRNFGAVVQDQLARSARAAQPAAPRGGTPEDVEAGDPQVASAAAAAPSGPTSQSVAQTATFADVMALREVNLIGVFGQPSDRRALVRMGNGRYLRVGVGDSLDGGQVTAIGDNALNYTKRGRQVQLVIPGG